jgi:hypothetical protein
MFHSIGTRHAAEARLSVSMILSARAAEWFMRCRTEKHQSDAEIPMTDHTKRAPIIKPWESSH